MQGRALDSLLDWSTRLNARTVRNADADVLGRTTHPHSLALIRSWRARLGIKSKGEFHWIPLFSSPSRRYDVGGATGYLDIRISEYAHCMYEHWPILQR